MTASRPVSARLACALVGVAVAVAGCHSTAPNVPQQESSSRAIVPMPDQASMQQVIDPAKEFLVLNRLRDVSGVFGWVACGRPDEALYYGEVRMSFLLPENVDEGRYLAQIAKMMVSHGWMDAPVGGDRPSGTVLHTNEVRAEITGGNPANRERGTIRLSGECRNTNDHRDDTAGIDITARLTS